jgi:L-threonylcarbamoyladenylate synthase
MSLVPTPDRLPLILDATDPVAIVEAGRLIRQGLVVVIPTDTGYGISAGVFHPESVERVFAIKRRDPTTRIPLLVPTAADLPLVARDVPGPAWRLIARFWPGPLSIVLPAKGAVPRSVTGGRGTVAVRVPNGRVCLQLLEFLGEPITGTSANLSGKPGAVTAADALAQFGPTVDAILVDDGAIVHQKASTVVEFVDGVLTVHREGMLSADTLRTAATPRMGAEMQLVMSRNRR